jgi:cytochrome c oxidase assembly protein subunit 15
MDGRWIPAGYLDLAPFWRNLTENIPAVQFNHRLLASGALLAALAAAGLALRLLPRGFARRAVLLMAGAVVAQYALGIATLLWVVPVSLGTLHQTLAVGVLAAGLVAVHALRAPARTGEGIGAPARTGEGIGAPARTREGSGGPPRRGEATGGLPQRRPA